MTLCLSGFWFPFKGFPGVTPSLRSFIHASVTFPVPFPFYFPAFLSRCHFSDFSSSTPASEEGGGFRQRVAVCPTDEDVVDLASADPLWGEIHEEWVDKIDKTLNYSPSKGTSHGREEETLPLTTGTSAFFRFHPKVTFSSSSTTSLPQKEELLRWHPLVESPSTSPTEATSWLSPLHLQQLQCTDLVQMVMSYLLSGRNLKNISLPVEHLLFPVLLDRLTECSLNALLDLLEVPWPTPTHIRYGITFNDRLRDRLCQLGYLASSMGPSSHREDANGENSHASAWEAEGSGNEGGDDSWKSSPTSSSTTFPSSEMITQAQQELNPENIIRATILLGMSGGHRKRDVPLFSMLGVLIAHYINQYRNPEQLIQLLTAFSRAKILPPSSFLHLIGRRLPVLSKNKKLTSLDCYRAMVNLSKRDMEQTKTFRFLADRIYLNIYNQTKWWKQREREKGVASSPARNLSRSRELRELLRFTGVAIPLHRPPSFEKSEGKENKGHEAIQILYRFFTLTGLPPALFSKMLLLLAKMKAPHQLYCRPIADWILRPSFHVFPPPSFSRMLKALRLFNTVDRSLLEAIIGFITERLSPREVTLGDLILIMRLLMNPDMPIPTNLRQLILLAAEIFGEKGRLRPMQMVSVAQFQRSLQQRAEIPLEMVAPFIPLINRFAEFMNHLISLHVISLPVVEQFEEICELMKHPDTHGALARLKTTRREKQLAEGGESAYEEKYPLEVRQLFEKLMIISGWNTFGDYRPIPGPLQVDFKQFLGEVSAMHVLESVRLFQEAYPGRLSPVSNHLLSRAVVGKVHLEGEEVICTDPTGQEWVEMRFTRKHTLFTREMLHHFVTLLQETQLKIVYNHPHVWTFIQEKATKLQHEELSDLAHSHLKRLALAISSP